MNKFLGKSKKGFTLIELMIVVAIIGILAAIAIPNFVRFQLKAKTSEGKVNLAAIRTAEEAYFSEFGSYVAATASPVANGGTAKVNFVDTGSVVAGNFDTIGWAPEGQVFFNYEVVVLDAAYVANAGADIDGNGTDQAWGYVQPGTGVALAGSLGGENCSVTDSLSNQVVACDPTYGQSEF
jgi:type IV pilus assembly protein PilA